MKLINKTITVLALALCVSLVAVINTASASTYQSTIFANYDVYIPSSMKAEFSVTTRKVVSSVSISATMQVYKNGAWRDCSTGVTPAFSGSNKTGWDTTADYSSACEKGYKYRLIVTYSSSGATASCTSNESTYN